MFFGDEFVRVAQTSRVPGDCVLAVANFFCESTRQIQNSQSSLRRDTATSTRDACAPQSAPTHLPNLNVERWTLKFFKRRPIPSRRKILCLRILALLRPLARLFCHLGSAIEGALHPVMLGERLWLGDCFLVWWLGLRRLPRLGRDGSCRPGRNGRAVPLFVIQNPQNNDHEQY